VQSCEKQLLLIGSLEIFGATLWKIFRLNNDTPRQDEVEDDIAASCEKILFANCSDYYKRYV